MCIHVVLVVVYFCVYAFWGGRVGGIGKGGISFAVYFIQLIISGKGIGGWFCCSNTVSVNSVMDI